MLYISQPNTNASVILARIPPLNSLQRLNQSQQTCLTTTGFHQMTTGFHQRTTHQQVMPVMVSKNRSMIMISIARLASPVPKIQPFAHLRYLPWNPCHNLPRRVQPLRFMISVLTVRVLARRTNTRHNGVSNTVSGHSYHISYLITETWQRFRSTQTFTRRNQY